MLAHLKSKVPHRHFFCWIGCFCLLSIVCTAAAAFEATTKPARSSPRLERLHPKLDALIAEDAAMELLAEGHDWVEGPVYVSSPDRLSTRFNPESPGFLLYTDIPRNAVYRWSQANGSQVFLQPSGYTGHLPFAGREPGANGLALDRQGRLVLAEHGDRRVTRLERDGSKTVLVSHFQGRRLNSPNDLLFDREGNLYFTDPPFGLPGQFDDPARELGFCGVFRLSVDGELSLLSDQLQAPNGIALSPDQSTLYVTDVGSQRPAWWAFPLNADGGVGSGRVFRDAGPFLDRGPGGPDGLKTDRHGNLFATGPGGIYVFSDSAELLGWIDLGSATSNLGWGEDGRSLFITAGQSLFRLRTLSGVSK